VSGEVKAVEAPRPLTSVVAAVGMGRGRGSVPRRVRARSRAGRTPLVLRPPAPVTILAGSGQLHDNGPGQWCRLRSIVTSSPTRRAAMVRAGNLSPAVEGPP